MCAVRYIKQVNKACVQWLMNGWDSDKIRNNKHQNFEFLSIIEFFKDIS